MIISQRTPNSNTLRNPPCTHNFSITIFFPPKGNHQKKKLTLLLSMNSQSPIHLVTFSSVSCPFFFKVSVPCSSLFDIVTVRCGHCANLWSVNMAATFQSLSEQEVQAPNYGTQGYRTDLGSSSKCNNKFSMRAPANSATAEERVVNRPPEKRHRVPSAYNQFIKEEIQRIKANNPDISHREAFSTAAKNWAHFPHIHFGLMLETNNQTNYAG